MSFSKWLDIFLSEKEVSLDETFEVEGNSGTNFFTYGVITEAMESARPDEQAALKNKMVAIDFANGDVRDFMQHLGKCFAV